MISTGPASRRHSHMRRSWDRPRIAASPLACSRENVAPDGSSRGHEPLAADGRTVVGAFGNAVLGVGAVQVHAAADWPASVRWRPARRTTTGTRRSRRPRPPRVPRREHPRRWLRPSDGRRSRASCDAPPSGRHDWRRSRSRPPGPWVPGPAPRTSPCAQRSPSRAGTSSDGCGAGSHAWICCTDVTPSATTRPQKFHTSPMCQVRSRRVQPGQDGTS